jgi:hypothetical protein
MADLPGGASGFPSKTSRARFVTLWVSEKSPQGCCPRLQADAGARRVSFRQAGLSLSIPLAAHAGQCLVNAGRLLATYAA